MEENLLNLGDEIRTITPMSPESCSRFCTGKQNLFFILKHEYDCVKYITFYIYIYIYVFNIST